MPATAAVVNVNVAPTALFDTLRPTAVEAIPVNVGAVVLPLLVTLVTPVEPVNATVTPVVSVKLMFSMLLTFDKVTVEPATEPVMFNVSVPAPPFNVSPVVNVALAAVAVVLGALNVSLPPPPVKLFRSVVSGQVTSRDKYLIFKEFL